MFVLKRELFSDIILLLCLVILPEKATGREYKNCWNGVASFSYSGTQSETITKIPCQRWDSQIPHSHSYVDENFIDGSLAAAENYCRNPDADDSDPWCYTSDPDAEREICDVPICKNMICEQYDETGYLDDDTLTDLNIDFDDDLGVNVLLKDGVFRLFCCGTISQWKMVIVNEGTIRLQVWRQDTTTGKFILKGENVFTYSFDHLDKIQSETIQVSERISFEEGDFIGWYSESDYGEMISYDFTTVEPVGNLRQQMPRPSVKQAVNFGEADDVGDREYAIGAILSPNLDPYFNNGITEIEITDMTAIKTVLLLLSPTDDDVNDVETLVVTMETATNYFALQTLTVHTKVNPPLPVGVYILKFKVTDHCQSIGVLLFTVRVVKQAVKINNLPGFGSVSESVVTETLVKTLTFDSAGPHTCSIDTYEPTRTEGNPFLIKNGFDVNLKDNANVRYNVTTSYTLTITCTDGSTSDTAELTINLTPNPKPTFDNWQASVTVRAPSTTIGDVVHTAHVTDSDPLRIAFYSCTPTPCPFTCDNDGKITASKNLLLHEVTQYEIILSADDTFNVVTSPPLTITITAKGQCGGGDGNACTPAHTTIPETNALSGSKRINEKPIFTNIPNTKGVLEGTEVGSVIFHVSFYDGNTGDGLVLNTEFNPPECETLFHLKPTTGEITTLAELDFESVAVKSCELAVTANDGKVNSTTEIVTLNIIDIDEAPEFSQTLYRIVTPEVSGGAILPDPEITCTDPENMGVTLSSLNCGTADNGYLSLNPTSYLLTMVTAYDLDNQTPPLTSKTFSCTFICTDGTGQMSEASLEVKISDANDETPTFLAAMFSVNIDTNQPSGTVISVPATDHDTTSPNNLVSYSLSGSPSFDIDHKGNVLLIGDITADTTYTLTATATDGGITPLSSTATVKVIVSAVTTTSSTTTTTTTTTQSPAAPSNGIGWLDSDVNKIWFAIALLVLLCLLAGLFFLVYYCCRRKNAGASMTEYKVNNKDVATTETNKVSPARSSYHNKTNGRISMLTLDETRPGSGDSGINVSPTSRSNASLTGISVHPTEDNLSGNGIADVDADGNRRRAQIQRMLSKKMKPWIPY